ncbi:MAG: sugar phosphate nucleotidyltransferase [Candidatus Shapirobacteria bacterium]
MKPVLICGGVGTKMWPESKPTSPKHFLTLIDGKSLFQLNWEALRLKFKPEEIYLQTNSEQAIIAKEQVPEVVDQNIFIEPEMRNQGPATCLAAANLYKIDPDEPFILVQADVLREPADKFIEMIEVCDGLIKKEGRLITGGNKPEYAIMGIDYLIKGEEVGREGSVGVFKVDQFMWRSSKEAVESLVADGRALTHANHYAWTPRKLMELLQARKPEWYGPLMAYIDGADLTEQYALMPKGPMEDVTQEIFAEALVVELPFKWIDFGTWESVAKYLTEKGQYQSPEGLVEIESSNNFVRVPENKKVAIIGVSDLVVIDTSESLLICPKSESGRVGEVVKIMELRDGQ